jgi:predicted phage terminase large subunit-like protein
MTGLLPGPKANSQAHQIRLKLFKWQADFLRMRHKLISICVGRRSGKSVALAARLLVGPKGLAQGFPCMLAAHKRDGVMAVESELIRMLGPLLERHPRRDGWIFLPTKAELHVWVLGNRQTSMRAGRGERYGTAVLDECAWCAYLWDGFFSAVQPALSDYSGYAVFASTPRGRRNDYHRIHKFCEGDPYGNVITGSTYDCNPIVSIREFFLEQQHRASKGRLNPKIFKQEYLAQFVDLEESLITPEMLQRHEFEPDIMDDDLWSRHIGVDLAISTKEESDFTAFVCTARHRGTGEIYVADAVQFKESLPNRILERLLQFCKIWKPSKVVVEATQFQAALVNQWMLDFPSLGIIPVKPDKDKVTRMQPVAARYAASHVYHSCKLSDEFEMQITTFPICEHDDMCDALCYSVMSHGHLWDVKQGSGDVWTRENEDYRPPKPWMFAA